MEYKNSLEQIKESIKHGKLEEKIGYHFFDKELLVTALTHKSYIYYFKQNYTYSNERLEFLGDAVLGLVISEILMSKFPKEHEGTLTKIKSHIVSRQTLHKIADRLNLGEFILLGKSEFTSDNHNKKSIISDAVESLIGAIYLDGDLEAAKLFIKKHFSEFIVKPENNMFFEDYKSLLQEKVQKKFKVKPEYRLVKEEGLEHKKIFFVQTVIKGVPYGSGKGNSKKQAEQNAAKETLKQLKTC
jgi:ribonuclease-3